MVDAEQRQAAAQCQAFGGVHSHHQRAHQTRAARYSNCVDVAQRNMRLLERRVYYLMHKLHMRARCHLRKHPAVLRVQLGLRGDYIGEHRAAVFHHPRCGFIAGGFNAKYARRHGVGQPARTGITSCLSNPPMVSGRPVAGFI